MKINNVYLINTPIYNNDEGIYPPLGLLSIAAFIKENNKINVSILDMAIQIYSGKVPYRTVFDNTLLTIERSDTKLIGITTQNFSLAAAITLAQEIKRIKPDVHIFLVA